MRRVFVVLSTLMIASLLEVAPAQADDRTCRRTIGGAHIDGNVIVPSGARCTLKGTRIDGNVEVKRRAKLVARGVRVGGNIQTQDHGSVLVKTRKSAVGS